MVEPCQKSCSLCTHKDENYHLRFQILKTFKKITRDMKERHKSQWETLKNEVMEYRKEPDISHSKMKSKIESTQESPYMTDYA